MSCEVNFTGMPASSLYSMIPLIIDGHPFVIDLDLLDVHARQLGEYAARPVQLVDALHAAGAADNGVVDLGVLRLGSQQLHAVQKPVGDAAQARWLQAPLPYLGAILVCEADKVRGELVQHLERIATDLDVYVHVLHCLISVSLLLPGACEPAAVDPYVHMRLDAAHSGPLDDMELDHLVVVTPDSPVHPVQHQLGYVVRVRLERVRLRRDALRPRLRQRAVRVDAHRDGDPEREQHPLETRVRLPHGLERRVADGGLVADGLGGRVHPRVASVEPVAKLAGHERDGEREVPSDHSTDPIPSTTRMPSAASSIARRTYGMRAYTANRSAMYPAHLSSLDAMRSLLDPLLNPFRAHHAPHLAPLGQLRAQASRLALDAQRVVGHPRHPRRLAQRVHQLVPDAKLVGHLLERFGSARIHE
uniref:Uncharacterized protein n=1 Tax=Siphoviridae sp. ctAvf12 TaxID=2826185 RepID=A0A8S5QKT8_9CAUD|nr:MAG TPA: hypothetical protein [Siphoviridae sp. ctAvf12]